MNELNSLGDNFEAYKACLELAQRSHWWGVHTALQEDGYTDTVNYVVLRDRWLQADPA